MEGYIHVFLLAEFVGTRVDCAYMVANFADGQGCRCSSLGLFSSVKTFRGMNARDIADILGRACGC